MNLKFNFNSLTLYRAGRGALAMVLPIATFMGCFQYPIFIFTFALYIYIYCCSRRLLLQGCWMQATNLLLDLHFIVDKCR